MAQLTLADVYRAASDLETGTKTPSVKLALWAAILSARASLKVNSRQFAIVKQWASTGLPADREQVWLALKGTGKFTRTQRDGLYWAEMLEQTGKLEGLADIGADFDAQSLWREQVYSLMHGHGMSYKTVSFAGLILDPRHCELVPVDRHVLARFGLPETYSTTKRRYLEVENMVRMERDSAGCEQTPLGLWHWLKWEQWRQAKYPKQAAKDGAESHAGLSCRDY